MKKTQRDLDFAKKYKNIDQQKSAQEEEIMKNALSNRSDSELISESDRTGSKVSYFKEQDQPNYMDKFVKAGKQNEDSEEQAV